MARRLVACTVAAVCVLMGIGFGSGAVGATTTPKTALVYGNTLMWESQWAIDRQVATKAGWSVTVHAFPSAVQCDFVGWLANDLATYHPSVVALVTAGGNASPCMVDANGNRLPIGSAEYYAKERADINAFFALATDAGARVVFISSPPFTDAALDAASSKITAIAKVLAASYPGVSVSAVPRNAVSNAGVYTASKPCLPTETAAMGCTPAHTIPVRTTAPGPQFGLHLCTEGLPAVYPWWCSSYSSGEYRWGVATVNTVVSPPAPIRPTVLVTAVAAVEGQPLTFVPRLKYPYSRDLTLCASTSDGTATVATGDYVPEGNHCFQIPAWSTTGPPIRVVTLADGVVEPDEALRIAVSGVTVPITGNVRSATGTIRANQS